MLKSNDPTAMNVIRSFLDKLDYAYMSYRMIPDHDTKIFPDFSLLHASLQHLYPIYRFVFTVFRQGHAADEAILREALPKDVLDAMIATGLLVQDKRKNWRTPSLAIVAVDGLYLVVSLPPQYPTAITRKQPIYIGPESIWLTKALPHTLGGSRVLDICAGSGIQGLLCAARGAAQVVCLEKVEEAVSIARFNVALNGLSDVVEVRHSDLFSALEEGEVFDFVVSNPPFMPVMEDVEYPVCGAGGADGTSVLRRIFEGLPAFLSDDARGVLFCNALGDQFSININRELLGPLAKDHGLYIRAYVNDKSPLSDYVKSSLDGNLKNSCPELTAEIRQEKIAAWLETLRQQGTAADYIYGQIIRFWKGRSESGLDHMPAYNPQVTDPLVVKTMLARIRA